MYRSRLFICLVLMGNVLQAQDFSWWNQIHNWDGITPWRDYLIVSPGYMGPNALPVPEIREGALPVDRSIEVALEGHYNRGDRSMDLYTDLYLPLFSRRVGLGISYVPIELYSTDTITRDIRRSREYDPRGVHFGDVYISTLILLVEETERIPGVLLSLNMKTASGTGFEGARHTNAPGYYFDLSAGKMVYSGAQKLEYLRLYGMVGFYVYQTNLVDHMQNDAFLYGAGVEMKMGRFTLEQQTGGYVGYLHNGDRPLVYRLNLCWSGNSGMDLKIRFQQGFLDFPFTSIRFSTIIRF